MPNMWSNSAGFSSVSLLPRPSSAKPKRRQPSKGNVDAVVRPTVADLANEPSSTRAFLETQRRSGKMAAKLQALLGTFQKPQLASKMSWVRSQNKQTERKIPGCVMSKDDLTQLLKAEEADRFYVAERRAHQLRAAVTIDDQAADELDLERRGTDAVQLTSDLHPGFADAMIRFGVLRHEVKHKAEERRAKANRLLSNMASEIRHGQGFSKRRLKRGRSGGFEDKVDEVQLEKKEPDAYVEDEREIMRRHRRELERPVAKFDKWVEGHIRRQGLVSRPKTAPAKIA